MFYIKAIFPFLLLFLNLSTALAAPENRSGQSHLEHLRWEATMAEGSHVLNPTGDTKQAWLNALDELAPYECMPDLHSTLSYEGDPSENTSCLEVLSKITELDPHRPVLACVEHGIDSTECQRAYQGQQVSIAPGSRVRARDRTSEARELNREFSRLRPLGNDTDLESFLETARVINTTLRASCDGITIKAIEERQVTERRPPRAPARRRPATESGLGFSSEDAFFEPMQLEDKDEEELSPMERLAARLGERDKGKEESVPATHTRYLPADCEHYVSEAKEISRHIASPICYEHGFFTPACIQARRLEQRALRNLGQDSDSNRGDSGLTSF